MSRHAQVVRWRGSRAVRSTNPRVVLRAAPAQADTRVSDGVTLHLIDGHLSSVAVDELNKAAAFARWDLDVGDLPKALEEGAKFILGDIARETADKDGGVVGVGELVHLAARVEPAAGAGSTTSVREAAHAATPHLLLGHAAGHNRVSVVAMTGEGVVVVAVLRGGGRDAHRSVATVDTLHLHKSPLLVILIREANEAVAAALSSHGIGHDLGRLAGREAGLEEGHEDILVHLRSEIADEDGILRASILAPINKTSAGSPVELELASAIGNSSSIQPKSLVSGLGSRELDKAIASVPRVLVTDDFDVDRLVSGTGENTLNKGLVHPWLKFAHPESRLGSILRTPGRRGRHSTHIARGRSPVSERHGVRSRASVGRDPREGGVMIHFVQMTMSCYKTIFSMELIE